MSKKTERSEREHIINGLAHAFCAYFRYEHDSCGAFDDEPEWAHRSSSYKAAYIGLCAMELVERKAIETPESALTLRAMAKQLWTEATRALEASGAVRLDLLDREDRAGEIGIAILSWAQPVEPRRPQERRLSA